MNLGNIQRPHPSVLPNIYTSLHKIKRATNVTLSKWSSVDKVLLPRGKLNRIARIFILTLQRYNRFLRLPNFFTRKKWNYPFIFPYLIRLFPCALKHTTLSICLILLYLTYLLQKCPFLLPTYLHLLRQPCGTHSGLVCNTHERPC